LSYKTKPVKGGYVIEKPNKEIIDDYIFKFEWQAVKRLKIIKAMGWCK